MGSTCSCRRPRAGDYASRRTFDLKETMREEDAAKPAEGRSVGGERADVARSSVQPRGRGLALLDDPVALYTGSSEGSAATPSSPNKPSSAPPELEDCISQQEILDTIRGPPVRPETWRSLIAAAQRFAWVRDLLYEEASRGQAHNADLVRRGHATKESASRALCLLNAAGEDDVGGRVRRRPSIVAWQEAPRASPSVPPALNLPRPGSPAPGPHSREPNSSVLSSAGNIASGVATGAAVGSIFSALSLVSFG